MSNYSSVIVNFLCSSHFLVNTSDLLTIESDTENRFVLEQLWSSGFLHHTVWLGMYFNIDSKNLSHSRTHQIIEMPFLNPFHKKEVSVFS